MNSPRDFDDPLPGQRREIRISLVQIVLAVVIAVMALGAWILFQPGAGETDAQGRRRGVSERSEQEVGGSPSIFDDAPPEKSPPAKQPPPKTGSRPKASSN